MDAVHARRRLPPLTDIRAERLRAGLTLAEVALESDLSSYRASLVERDPSRARPGEIEALRVAVDAIYAERARNAAQNDDRSTSSPADGDLTELALDLAELVLGGAA